MEKIKVYYDGSCYLCAGEIEMYRQKDKKSGIIFVDISSRDFDAVQHGLDPQSIHRKFHVRGREGNLLVGVEGFIAIWEEIESLRFLVKMSKYRPVRLLLEIGYSVFVAIRPYLPRKKCEKNICGV